MDPSEPSSGSQITGTARTHLRRTREHASAARAGVALAPRLERCAAEMALCLAPPAPPRRGAGR